MVFGFGSRDKVFFFGGTAVAGKGTGKGADLDLGEIGRGGEGVEFLVFGELGDDFGPDRGSTGDAGGDAAHG